MANSCLFLRSFAFSSAVFYADAVSRTPTDTLMKRLKVQQKKLLDSTKSSQTPTLALCRRVDEERPKKKALTILNQNLRTWLEMISRNRIQLLDQSLSAKMAHRKLLAFKS